METPIPGTAVDFAGHRYMFAVGGPDPFYLSVQVYDVTTGQFLGQTIRYKNADGRIAADFPSVNAATFIVDENGHITNG